ncbi:hypothetical protein V6Z11_D09G057900 [Gossypium hirsutum]
MGIVFCPSYILGLYFCLTLPIFGRAFKPGQVAWPMDNLSKNTKKYINHTDREVVHPLVYYLGLELIMMNSTHVFPIAALCRVVLAFYDELVYYFPSPTIDMAYREI